MPRKKEKHPVDYQHLQTLKATLWEKIAREWPEKWQPVFIVPFEQWHSISYSKFTRAIHQDIHETLKAKARKDQNSRTMFSEKTLKRILAPGSKMGLQTYTKDTISIYLGYKDYAHFIQQHDKQAGQTTNKLLSGKLLTGMFLLILLLGAGTSWFIWSSQPDGIPGFHINLLKDSTDLPATLQISYKNPWDKPLQLLVSEGHYSGDTFTVNKQNGMINEIKWRPMALQIKLNGEKEVLQDTGITINSQGWSSWYTHENERKALAPKDIYKHDGFMWYPPTSVPPEDRKDYWTKFRFIQPFQASADSIQAVFRVKNSDTTGGLYCFDTGFAVYGSNGRFWSVFQKKGCNYYSRFEAPDTAIHRENFLHLQKMAANLSEYTNLTLNASFPYVSLLKGQDTVFAFPYGKEAGQLQGFDVFFRGSGMLDKVSILENGTDTVFHDEFQY